MLRIIFFFLSFAWCYFAHSQSTFELTTLTDQYSLDAHAEIYLDSENRTPFEKIRSSEFKNNFQPSHKESLTFGYLEKPIWIKLSLKNLTSNKWCLEIPAPYLAYLDYYYLDSGIWKSISCGYYLPHSRRGIPDTGFTFPIHFDEHSEATLYLCVTGLSPKNIPLFVVTPDKFIEESRLKDVWYGVFFGVMLVMMLYNLIIAVRLEDGNYLIYIFTIICTLLIFGSAAGYTGKYLWPNAPQLNYYAGRLTLSILMFLMGLFTARFLETKRYSKTMHTLLNLVMVLAVLSFFLVLTSVVQSAANNLTSLATPIFLVSGIVCWKNGNKNARYFVTAWSIYLVGGLSATLRNSGVLPANFWTNHLAEIGAACETIFIALALSERYNNLKRENEESQLALIEQLQKNQQLQRQVTNDLEEKVAERTKEIKDQNEKLTKLNLLKDKLFSIISHDIKTPLSQLSGTLYLVEKDMISKEEIKNLMPQIRRTLVNNENFLAELLAWTKNQLEGGKINRTYFNLKIAADQILSLIQPQADGKKITIINQLNDSVNVYADAEMIKTVIRNLIVNAVKFTMEGGSIEISVRVTNEVTSFFVSDTGVGIAEERKNTLFTMGAQSTFGTYNEKGTGLGLLICKDFIDNNGGKIWVESQLGQGSVFAFTLPNHPTENFRLE